MAVQGLYKRWYEYITIVQACTLLYKGSKSSQMSVKGLYKILHGCKRVVVYKLTLLHCMLKLLRGFTSLYVAVYVLYKLLLVCKWLYTLVHDCKRVVKAC